MGKGKKKDKAVLVVASHRKDMKTEIDKRLGADLDDMPRAGTNNHATGTLEALQYLLAQKPKKRDQDMLHDIIFKEAIKSTPWPEIARITGVPIVECRQIYQKMLDENYDFSPDQMRKHLTAVTMSVIDMVHEAASLGSDKHADVILKATERLAKMHELEVQRSTLEISIVTDHQTTLLLHILSMVIERFVAIPEVAMHVQPEVIDSFTAEVLELAGAELVKAQEVIEIVS